jgi:hypothetical protein
MWFTIAKSKVTDRSNEVVVIKSTQKVETKTNTFLSFLQIRTSMNNFLDLWGVSLFFEGHFLQYVPRDYVEFNSLINL